MLLVPLRSSIATSMDLTQQPGHVRGKRPHGLHTFGVEFHLALSCTVGNVPVLGGYYRHVHHLEHHVHGLECGRCAAATTDGYSRSRLVLYQVACRVEQPLHQREDAAVGLAVIDWSANYQRIAHTYGWAWRLSGLFPSASRASATASQSPADSRMCCRPAWGFR